MKKICEVGVVIDILMATYNGEKYLRPQLDSILQQSNQEWRLIIRDDCSTDKTVQIIKEYQLLRPEQIVLLQAEQPSGSAQNNFFQLLQYSKAEYIMFADQDDVWLKNKVQLTLDKMQQLEQQYGKDMPLLVHTDLAVVDERLHILNNSMTIRQNINIKKNGLNNILVQNTVTGCSMMINQSLKLFVAEIPKEAIMHDMWFALIAAAFGHIDFVEKATILYRQHSDNVVGAKNTYYYLTHLKTEFQNLLYGQRKRYRQAAEFLEQFRDILPEQHQQLLYDYSALEDANLLRKIFVLTRYHLYKKGVFRKIGQIIL